MSLRNQFYVSVMLALFVSLLFLGAMASWHARLSVQNELHAALLASNRTAEAMLNTRNTGLEDLTRLVRSFDGNRHVRAEFISNARLVTASTLATPQNTPDWFINLLRIPSEKTSFPIGPDQYLLLGTDPGNEIGEVWNQFRDGAVMMALFGALMLGLLHVLMARTAAPLKKLAAGFDAIGSGDYAIRVNPAGPSEISRLAGSFNRMTERLQKLEESNRNLNMQMLTIQEEERADLARDLHDEMGPFLFTMRVDAENIGAQAQAENLPAIAKRARAIGDAVSHIQGQVRLILKQLRPINIADVGLSHAIANLATFWQRHHNEVKIHIDVVEKPGGFGKQTEAAIYRLVQESLTNAVRHGAADNVSVAIVSDGDKVLVRVEDNGAGLPEGTETGMGLRGMQERVTGLGGTLTLSSSKQGGTIIAAEIPCKTQTLLVEPVI